MKDWTQKDFDVISYIVGENDADPAYVIPILRGIQKIYRYLPEPAMVEVARLLEVSLAKVFGVALQCAEFELNPPGTAPQERVLRAGMREAVV
ncbi:MAG: hypothetical protein GX606_03085 [Elusimicrobia bacterium]|nr:hypothetical protein [Elusimicrobiota bacterium]